MKRVLILRHADWDNKVDELTAEGREHAEELAAKLPKFAAVYSSPTNRTRQTATILSSQEPTTNSVFAPPTTAPELREAFLHASQTHPLGKAGAVFVVPAVREAFRQQAEQAVQVIHDILANQNDGATVLVTSHDGVMVAIEKLITGAPFDTADHTYGELQGYFVELLSDSKIGLRILNQNSYPTLIK